ncbi:MAG TPA: SWIM zinc finger family protein [Bellilinea sp.]|nr:SWIM zinc finger family protein [Bellilinea sp.]
MIEKPNNSWGMNPRQTSEGIRAFSEGASFGRNWWARRWITAMEQLVSGPRLMRGQYYARQGQIISITESKEGIHALVQGSRPRPYKVNIRLTPLTPRQWNRVLDVLADQAIFAAQLLSGEMPSNIEEAFSSAGVSLFPQNHHDLITSCSCPDKANPCKHVAAAHYILGERFDEDPFLLFRMRGRTQEQILTALRQRRDTAAPGGGQKKQSAQQRLSDAPKLEDQAENFWQIGMEAGQFSAQVRTPEIGQPLLKRLGEPDFVRDLTLQNQLEDVYNTISQFAMMIGYSDMANAGDEDDD